MDARFYNSEEIDLEKLATDLENVFRLQGYEAQHLGNKDQTIVQLKKGSDLVALIGLQTALSVTFQRTSGGVVAMLGRQQWVDKAAVGAVGLIAAPVLWPLMITAGAGALKQASLASQVLSTVDSLVLQQMPGTQVGPLPVNLMPQFQQQWASPPPQYAPPAQSATIYVQPTPVYTPPPVPVYTPPAPAKPRCPSCNTSYEPGDTFCSGCGRGLTPPKKLCPNCQTEVKPGVAFCHKCGANTFQATQQQAAKPAPTPASKPPVPTYTPPSKPPTPVYTPPKPPTPVYTPPIAPTVAAKPAEPEPYVPPVPQDPPVMPQPAVTLIPGKPKPTTPTPPPPKPSVPVYVPPKPLQPPPTVAAAKPQTPPPPSATIKARPVSQPLVDLNVPWGTLIFNNGNEVTLRGERVLVGRYDHDLGGVQPEVDLGTFEGADTVSRGHATIEHIGSLYQLIDLNSTNFTRINGKRLEANVPTPISDGDTLQFGKISCTFKKI
jgi:hypothetical protein